MLAPKLLAPPSAPAAPAAIASEIACCKEHISACVSDVAADPEDEYQLAISIIHCSPQAP